MVTGCAVEVCRRPHKARGYCVLHYRRVARTGTTGLLRARATVCITDGCDEEPIQRSALCTVHEKERRRQRDAWRKSPEGIAAAGLDAQRKLDEARGSRPRERDKGYEAYVTNRRSRGVPIEGLPTYTLLPLVAQLEAIDAMRVAS